MAEHEQDDVEFSEEERDAGSFASKVIPDLFRRALMTGIGTVFMTEEGIRNTLSDMKVPKEAMNYVVSQADRTKRELISTLARELRTFLNDLQLEELISKGFEGKTFEIHTTIRVHGREDGGQRLEVENSSSVKADEADAPEKKKKKASRPRAKSTASKARSTRKKTKSAADDE